MLKTLVALTLATAALPAFAGEVRTATPMQAQSIATPAVDMVAYFVPVDGDGFEVTATWLGAEDDAPSRLVMRLQDGDRVSFALPGHKDTLYTFVRDFDAVSISAEPAETEIRNASL